MEPRIQIAAMALQGLLANPRAAELPLLDDAQLARLAVSAANALLAELARTAVVPPQEREPAPRLAVSREPEPEVDDYLASLCDACRDGEHGMCVAIETDAACRCKDTKECSARTLEQLENSNNAFVMALSQKLAADTAREGLDLIEAQADAPEQNLEAGVQRIEGGTVPAEGATASPSAVKPEISGTDPGWWWAKHGDGWHLWHEKSDDSYCHEEEAGRGVELVEVQHPPASDPDAVCLECSEAKCEAGIRWRAARDAAAKLKRAEAQKKKAAAKKSELPCGGARCSDSGSKVHHDASTCPRFSARREVADGV